MLRVDHYYSGRILLVTGATGLVGKVLLEAILRKLPDVGRVYVLIRPRTDDSGVRWEPARRLEEEILGSSAFDSLRAEHGRQFEEFARQRLEAIEGDLSEERLGIEPATYEKLSREVEVVINSGALAVFDAPFDQALQTNALGPQRILELAKASSRRPFVAHVSTCYVSRLAGPVFETPLDPRHRSQRTGPEVPFDVDEEVRAALERVDLIRSRKADSWLYRVGHSLRAAATRGRRAARDGAEDPEAQRREEWIEKRLVEEGLRWARRRGWNDTYTFTKAMGELLFLRYQGDLPGLILRPSIIESSLRTPAPGWIDGFRMMDPLIVGFARGQIFEFPGNPEALVDLVPADSVVDALLVAVAWSHAGRGPRLFQVASGMENPLILKDFRDYLVEYYEHKPLSWRGSRPKDGLPRVTFPELRRFLRRLDTRYLFPLRLLGGLLAPLKATSRGRRWHSQLGSRRTGLERLRRFAIIYGPYAESQARFLSFNVRRMWEALSAEERRKFPFAVTDLDWKRYLQDVHLPGIERYLLGKRQQGDGDALEPSTAEEPSQATACAEAGRGLEEAAAVSADDEEAAPGPCRWTTAERVLSLTQAVQPEEVQRWLTPSYKKLLRRLSALLIRLICKHRLALAWSGQEHVPERGPFIVVSNHSSHADTGVLLTALGRLAPKVHPTAATDYWFRSPLMGWILDCTLGAIPFDRFSRNVPRALALPAEILRRGHSLIFYPEGTRSTTGKLQRFKSTVGLLALASAAPVLPAYIEGTFETLPKGRTLVKQHPVHVRFGRPRPVEPYLRRLDRESVFDLARRLAEDLQAAVESLRGEPAGT